MDKGLNGWVLEEVFVVDDESVVNIAVVCKVYVSVLEEVVVDLVPGVFDESDGYVAKGRGELGSNPSPSDLLVSVVACPENTSVECIGDNGGDVRGLDGALCGVFLVMPANVGVVEWVAGCVNINGEGVASAESWSGLRR